MREIRKPSEGNYWVAKSNDGSVVHVGFTEPNQVTSTGLDILLSTPEPTQHLKNLRGLEFSELADETLLHKGQVYSLNGRIMVVTESHLRENSDSSKFAQSASRLRGSL